MESNVILITQINDFIFCPVSIYFHNLYGDADRTMYQSAAQINGTAAHKSIDEQQYSTKAMILQGISVYSEEHGLVGKIDMFDVGKGLLVERKKKIKHIYDGYIFQLYAQCLALSEMGYEVRKMRLHSMDDNTNYDIPLPKDNPEMYERFVHTISEMRAFDMDLYIQSNSEKCKHCIYEPACDRGMV